MEQQTLAIYIGNEDKCFVIHVERSVGLAIAMSMRGEHNERPLTHELIGYIFTAFEIKVERIVINALRSNTYYARIILRAHNEVHSKVIEIDARPSDCMVLATQAKAPIYVSRDVWDETDDRSDELEKIRQALREKKGHPPLFGDGGYDAKGPPREPPWTAPPKNSREIGDLEKSGIRPAAELG